MAKKPEQLPDKKNFIEWYNALLRLAEIVDRSYPIKGTFVWLPYGLEMMKNIVGVWDALFREAGIQEVYFPLFVPIDFAKKNDLWFAGFEDELFYVHDHKGEFINAVLRPTGEPAMYPIFRNWVKDGKLPIKVYQTVSSFRYEGKTTHTLIRDREITFWYEIHTAHKTKEESLKEMQVHKEINNFIWEKVLFIPPLLVKKPKYELFPGAETAFEYYTILPNGRLLENGSINNLGQAYAKKFDIAWVDENGQKHYVWQVCTGNGARFLVASITLHGDDFGLVVPPTIAPIEIVIIPIYNKDNKDKVIEYVKELENFLYEEGFDVYADLDEDKTAGEKFNIWDLKGVPIRLDIGAKEIDEDTLTLYIRATREKIKVKREELIEKLYELLDEKIGKIMFEKVEALYKEKIKEANSKDEVLKLVEKGLVAKANWCESKECFDAISSWTESLEAIGTLLDEEKEGKCIACGKETKKLTLIGKTY